MKPTPLCLLANKCKTDKGPIKHNYTQHYYGHFHKLVNEPFNILEIGVAFGGSIRMWLEFFPNAKIFGIDKAKMFEGLESDRFTFIQGKQSQDSVYEELLKKCDKFDIIIDDGSHRSEDELISLNKLFVNHVKLNGFYIIEDLHTIRHSKIVRVIKTLHQFNEEGYFFNEYLDYYSNYVISNSIRKCKIYDEKIAFLTKKEFIP